VKTIICTWSSLHHDVLCISVMPCCLSHYANPSMHVHQKTEHCQVFNDSLRHTCGSPHNRCRSQVISPTLKCRRAKQAGRGGHADKLLKAHSRDLGQRQQLACPQAASGLFAHQVRCLNLSSTHSNMYICADLANCAFLSRNAAHRLPAI